MRNKHTEVNDMVATGQDATTPPLKSAQPPKDNQIDEILANFYNDIAGNVEGVMREYHQMEFLEARRALATAIGEATPGQLTEFHGQGTMQLEAKVHQAALDQFLANLKDIGLEV